MPSTAPASIEVDDPALAGGDWLFQKGGQVYGPVEGRRLAALLYRGEISAATLVSSGDGTWLPLVQVGAFLVHLRKAEAALRVEQEVTGARALQARRARTRTVALVVAALLLVVGAAGVAFLLGRGTPGRSPLLDDFGAGISIAVQARVAVAGAAPADEVEVTLGGASSPPARPAAPRPGGTTNSLRAANPASGRPTGAVEGGELVETQFDAGRIQAVVSTQQRTLARCLREQAARAPDFSGEVPLEFTVGNEGKVVRVAVTDPRLRQGALRDCFEAVLSAWTFDRFPGQRPTVSLVFRVGAP
jgi:hypothetical protein